MWRQERRKCSCTISPTLAAAVFFSLPLETGLSVAPTDIYIYTHTLLSTSTYPVTQNRRYNERIVSQTYWARAKASRDGSDKASSQYSLVWVRALLALGRKLRGTTSGTLVGGMCDCGNLGRTLLCCMGFAMEDDQQPCELYEKRNARYTLQTTLCSFNTDYTSLFGVWAHIWIEKYAFRCTEVTPCALSTANSRSCI